jgi:hypothetical protein
MPQSVLYMSMSLDGFIAAPNDEPGNPGGDEFMRLHEWYGFASDGPEQGAIPTPRSEQGRAFMEEVDIHGGG